MTTQDTLGDRMKAYEMAEAGRVVMPKLPVMVRLDGKAFHTFTRGLARPFDMRLTTLMMETTKHLVEQTNAVVGFHQSDEISLVLYNEKEESELYFGGRIQKLTSVITSMATCYFNRHLPIFIPEKADKFALFDCRVWNVPSLDEAANCLLWRELDATKNAISMAAQSVYSHKELQHKNGKEKQEMLFAKGINFNNYPDCCKRGSYFRKVTKQVTFSSDEIENLPAKHAARQNPNLLVERSIVERANLQPLTCIPNKVDVLFRGAEPEIQQKVAKS